MATMEQDPALQSLSTLAKVNSLTQSTLPKTEKISVSVDHMDQLEALNPTHASEAPSAIGGEKTKLYLAYGSNLAEKTFKGTRGIRPLRSINVVVPSLQLVFDLAGIPYAEPCFANTRRRSGSGTARRPPSEKDALLRLMPEASGDLGWKKGLVGVVYEVTESDFATIIATEGGGSSYADIEVECFPLRKGDAEVPAEPSGESFRSHTLFASANHDRNRGRVEGWAQPSQRYLNLITSGAAENDLPEEYQQWLQQLKAFHVTTMKQTLGKIFLFTTWAPVIFPMFLLQRILADKKGRTPKWLGTIMTRLFMTVWLMYDKVYKKVFGEGERTIGDPF